MFQREYGVLVEGLSSRNPNSIYVYPSMIIFRLVFSIIPNIFKDRPVLQFIFLTSTSITYTAFFISCRAFLIFEDFVVEALNNILFIIMLYHLPIFMDGGLLNEVASLDQYFYIISISALTFMAFGVMIIAINILVLTKSIIVGAIKKI